MSLPVEDLLSGHSRLRRLDRVIGHAFSIFVVFRSQLHTLCSVILESQIISALFSPRVPPWMETLVVHCSSALPRSIPLVVAVFSVLHFFLMLTRTH